ncbi:coenzyme F420-dependent N5,N10-methenyltetrahydromethanopterin reductase [Amycolatopsis mediterranei S699]|uniref:Coenzyme F420-dependent N5,N10-methenyltetrahydromethanopterin reductase n=4 Tax=Amycolatopsis mediterranei TaxID=33910 RepID=A0A0H3D3I5_AMYMU|nr:TIGR03854 family LLM class F420-dependent oxidoreductase [Amycolatopsis mediterranei]ADJ45221.1 coenzyme F420-dependent N5,N10-methenyltetrahydromethanopterin reductase [Amycolatopsis mediterranei U32]AEK41981.1 coenzyme F420-dependent N5,N10-methenyltetrahydromethanopterin reductase [Amycolatopsis mediterranei S699]AFO76933.1 coenzyme F420-dependent N5,N10-methenyltetrahydromethanopterin reductase [Amycolatopsis mediterranei S699]AGT84061.1 coenzyme F420-dependent N5,N10-methenyltetrahydrom
MLKIRLGVAPAAGTGPAEFAGLAERLEDAGVDSLWLSELVYSPEVDPMIGMAHALARTAKLKVGTGVAILPGRHPVLVAKQLRTLAGLAPKRVLPVFGLRPARAAETALFPVPPGRRAAVFDESLVLLRRLLEEDEVSFDGEFFQVDDVDLGPRPANRLDVWLGGAAPEALRRTGRLADGWLGSFHTPSQARDARIAIQRAAAEAGREIEEDHFGLSLVVADRGIPGELAAVAERRSPGVPVTDLVATSWPEARRLVEQYIEAGLSKFVLRPGHADFDGFLEKFQAELVPLQN